MTDLFPLLCEHEYQYCWIYDAWLCVHCEKLKPTGDLE